MKLRFPVPGPWQCPYCGRDTTITDANYNIINNDFSELCADIPSEYNIEVVACPSPDCGKYAIYLTVIQNIKDPRSRWVKKVIFRKRIIPGPGYKNYDADVPDHIIEDYQEACLIRELSPKASATLARRCLQGMIRDFHGITGKNLHQEIEAIGEKLDPGLFDALMALKGLGNIGAHPEKEVNINLIIDIDPQEAELMIGIVEHLLDEWYVNRYKSRERLKAIVRTNQTKNEARTAAKEKKE